MNNPYQSPSAQQFPKTSEYTKLSVCQILFTMNGRIPRRTYWLYTILTVGSFIAIVLLTSPEILEESSEFDYYETPAVEQTTNLSADEELDSSSDVGSVIFFVSFLLMVWCSICISGKRWHDRDKSAWYVCVRMIPIIGPIWTFVENGCLRGTHGPNSYGPDPT